MQPDLATPATSGTKRALLALSAVVESFSFYILTLSRFEGKGLNTVFFRFSTKSDTISNLLYLFTLLMLLRAFRKPEIISLRRVITLTILAVAIMVVTLEVRNFEGGEFPRITSILYLICRALFFAMLVPRREYDLAHLAGIVQVIRNTALVLLISIVVAFVFSFTYNVTSDFNELKMFDADAGVVLGAAVWHGGGEHPSPTLKERINVAEDLMKRSIVPKLVVTGSNAIGEKPEAEIAKAELLLNGVEENRIVSETSSHSTLEQVLYLRNELVAKQGWKRFVIISDQYHLARVIEMCKFNGIDAIGTPSNIRQTVLDLAYYRVRESFALLAYWILGK